MAVKAARGARWPSLIASAYSWLVGGIQAKVYVALSGRTANAVWFLKRGTGAIDRLLYPLTDARVPGQGSVIRGAYSFGDKKAVG